MFERQRYTNRTIRKMVRRLYSRMKKLLSPYTVLRPTLVVSTVPSVPSLLRYGQPKRNRYTLNAACARKKHAARRYWPRAALPAPMIR